LAWKNACGNNGTSKFNPEGVAPPFLQIKYTGGVVNFEHLIQCEFDAEGAIPPNGNFFPQAWFLPTTVPTYHNGKNFHAIYPSFFAQTEV
jgi:hypothetical protein